MIIPPVSNWNCFVLNFFPITDIKGSFRCSYLYSGTWEVLEVFPVHHLRILTERQKVAWKPSLMFFFILYK